LSVKTGDRKIATFNVNGINGRLPVLLRWLAEAKPDVVCLQELKAPDEKFPEPAIREAGYRAVWHGQKSWNGVSVDREVRGWEKASLWRRRQPMPSTQGLCVGHPNGAFGLDRCMWGTGWTRAVALLTYEQGGRGVSRHRPLFRQRAGRAHGRDASAGL
jgi:Endonuclease/Exonuclease/phosphatase family